MTIRREVIRLRPNAPRNHYGRSEPASPFRATGSGRQGHAPGAALDGSERKQRRRSTRFAVRRYLECTTSRRNRRVGHRRSSDPSRQNGDHSRRYGALIVWAVASPGRSFRHLHRGEPCSRSLESARSPGHARSARRHAEASEAMGQMTNNRVTHMLWREHDPAPWPDGLDNTRPDRFMVMAGLTRSGRTRWIVHPTGRPQQAFDSVVAAAVIRASQPRIDSLGDELAVRRQQGRPHTDQLTVGGQRAE